LKSGTNLTVDPESQASVGVLRPSNLDDVEESPGWEPGYSAKKAVWDYPEQGGLYIFSKVPALGTKFNSADKLGPRSQSKTIKEIRGKVRFDIQPRRLY